MKERLAEVESTWDYYLSSGGESKQMAIDFSQPLPPKANQNKPCTEMKSNQIFPKRRAPDEK